MVVHGKRNDKVMSMVTYTVGDKKSFSEYMAPPREKGTKMLKIGQEMWMYSPTTDRTIMISGHMLRQSVMGSDLSYEDIMDDRKLIDVYDAIVTGEEIVQGRNCFLLTLTAKSDDVAYYKRILKVDKEHYVPLVQQLHAKSGLLLKQITLSDVQQVQNRYFPMKMNYKDALKDGNGTDWIISKITFDTQIPEHIFSKASLKQ
jgi:outer membrane lipoprotein-sorting protein